MSSGPTTLDGKQTSSRNSITHGCCASIHVLVGDERQEDFDRLRQNWFDTYKPEGQGTESLLEECIYNDWVLRRVQRQYHAVEQRLAECNPMDWTPEMEHKLQLMLRYKTAAERSFHRSLQAIERFRREAVYELLATDKKLKKMFEECMEEQRAKLEKQPPSSPPSPVPASQPKPFANREPDP